MKVQIKYIAIVCSIVLIFNLLQYAPVQAALEAPANTYTGIREADATIENITFKDVEAQGNNYWAQNAIYDMAALSIIKGVGKERGFGRLDAVTRTQALTLIYRAIGKEEEAKIEAENIEQQRAEDERRINAIDIWADGYLQLAANDGLISQQQLDDALAFDQEGLNPQENFIKTAPAERQEIAEWMAKALELTPIYKQQTIFNSFKDWKQADPLKIPYIETVLVEKIMNGSTDGYLYPTRGISREEMAQVLKNADDFILSQQNLQEHTGYIEGIEENVENQIGEKLITKTIKVRNSKGQLDHIQVQRIEDALGNIIETSKQSTEDEQKELIVVGKGVPGNSDSLAKGNEIRYITDENNNVRFVRITDAVGGTQKQIGDIVTVEYDTYKITIEMEEDKMLTYQVSHNAEIIINGNPATFDEVLEKAPVELTIQNNIVTKVEVKAKEGTLKENEVTGIVEEINPSLGYISLYDEKGKTSFNLLRIYHFLNPAYIKVIRNGESAEIDEVQQGDSIFLKLDENGYVSEIAASQNYIVKYGTVMTKNPTSMLVRFDNGNQQLLDINNELFISKNRKVTNYAAITPGNKIKMIVHQTEDFTTLKEIVIEKDNYTVSNIYKAYINYYDAYDSFLLVEGLTKLERGEWVLSGNKVFSEISVAENAEVYAANNQKALKDINKYYVDSEVYVAVEKGLGGEEKAVFISLINPDDTEKRYEDEIESIATGAKEFELDTEYETFTYTDGSIIVKNGKLITGNNLEEKDKAIVIANRSDEDGEYYAGVITVGEESTEDVLIVYRGRIEEINEEEDFTVESFAEFDDMEWDYNNTPKTFIITRNTRLLDESGVVNNREFNEYSDKDYIGKSVNIVAEGQEAVMIAESPYGEDNIKGEVYLNYGQKVDDTLSLKKAKIYDIEEGKWEEIDDIDITLRKDTIILKNSALATKSQIVRGTKVSILKKDSVDEALIIIIEN